MVTPSESNRCDLKQLDVYQMTSVNRDLLFTQTNFIDDETVVNNTELWQSWSFVTSRRMSRTISLGPLELQVLMN